MGDWKAEQCAFIHALTSLVNEARPMCHTITCLRSLFGHVTYNWLERIIHTGGVAVMQSTDVWCIHDLHDQAGFKAYFHWLPYVVTIHNAFRSNKTFLQIFDGR